MARRYDRDSRRSLLSAAAPPYSGQPVADSADEMYKVPRRGVIRNPSTTDRAYCDDSVEHFDWLEQQASTSNAATTPQSGDSAQHRRAHATAMKVWPFKDMAVRRPADTRCRFR